MPAANLAYGAQLETMEGIANVLAMLVEDGK
jgi:hypothetical protein